MTAHAKYALWSSCISQVFDLSLAISASEARRAEGLVTRQDSQIFDLVAASTAAVGAIIADEGAVAKEKKIRIRVE
jgi:hypothetical protein